MAKPKKTKFNFTLFMQQCINRGPKTFQDHAVASGLDQDWSIYSRVRVLVNEAIKPGGTHALLAGKVFLPDMASRRQPVWAAGLTQAASTTAPPTFTGSTALVAIRSAATNSSLGPAARRSIDALTLTLAKSSKKSQKIAQEVIEELTVEVARRDAAIEEKDAEINKLLREQVQELRAQLRHQAVAG